MTEVRIVTVMVDPRTGLFDDAPLRAWLADRELLRSEPYFYLHEGHPACAVYVVTRLRHGVTEPGPGVSPSGPAQAAPLADRTADPAAFLALLSELDEFQRARYDRLLAWRREVGRRDAVPNYVVMTNRQAMDLARQAPRTLAGLGSVKGFGDRRVAAYGREVLEVLHGPEQARGSERSAAVRTVDGHDEVASAADRALPEAAASQPGRPDRPAGGGDPRGRDFGGLQPGPAARAGGGERPDEPPAGSPAPVPGGAPGVP